MFGIYNIFKSTYTQLHAGGFPHKQTPLTISGPVSMATADIICGDGTRKAVLLFGDVHQSYENLCGISKKFKSHKQSFSSYVEEARSGCQNDCVYIVDLLKNLIREFRSGSTTPLYVWLEGVQKEKEVSGPLPHATNELLVYSGDDTTRPFTESLEIRYDKYFLYKGRNLINRANHLIKATYEVGLGTTITEADSIEKLNQFYEHLRIFCVRSLNEHVENGCFPEGLVSHSTVNGTELSLEETIIVYYNNKLKEYQEEIKQDPVFFREGVLAGTIKNVFEDMVSIAFNIETTLFDCYFALKLFSDSSKEYVVAYLGDFHKETLLGLLGYLKEKGKVRQAVVEEYKKISVSDEELYSSDEMNLSRCIRLNQARQKSFQKFLRVQNLQTLFRD